ncbi:synaptic vesicle glycoprotein 2B-like [Adelges cooleyi]|uniref:synaptic vesicle glycoprotein 2B-like n=1 Tax=Adelges cooleyi TaxID=133065 RepID=UPI00218017B1|nr:synaptic vesicle glycoprotein 2B-like [Adelges cooleyi]
MVQPNDQNNNREEHHDHHHRGSGIGTVTDVGPGTLADVPDDINVGVRKKTVMFGAGKLVTFEDAQQEAGTGMYQLALLIVCGMVNMACAISTTSVSFVTPAASADFQLTSITKGVMNGAPFVGMLIGAYFWGVCSDINGRRDVILGSMGMDAILSVGSCMAQHLQYFILIRVGNGFAIIGATCMIYVYFGEFLTGDKRDAYLLILEVFWALGMAAGPGVASIVIPLEHVWIDRPDFTFNSWRLFMLLTAVPSLLGFILVYQFPESPRYLMLKGRMLKSRDVLERIYIVNHSRKAPPYSVDSFTQTYSAIGFFDVGGMPFCMNLKARLVALKNGHKTLFSQYLRNIFVTCTIEFCLMASYVTVLVWVPELFSRYHDYEVRNAEDGGEAVNICAASHWLLKHPSDSAVKHTHVGHQAYVAAFVVASSTLIPITIMGLLIKCVSKKILLWISCGIPAVAALVMTKTRDDFEAEILCCFFEGFTTLVEPIIFCTMVELFPSNIRGVAFSLTVMCGRLGAVVGICVFGFLLDINCHSTFYLLATLLSIAFLAVICLPKLKIGGSH